MPRPGNLSGPDSQACAPACSGRGGVGEARARGASARGLRPPHVFVQTCYSIF